MTNPKDMAPEAEALAVTLARASLDCCEAGLSLMAAIEVVRSAYQSYLSYQSLSSDKDDTDNGSGEDGSNE